MGRLAGLRVCVVALLVLWAAPGAQATGGVEEVRECLRQRTHGEQLPAARHDLGGPRTWRSAQRT